MAARNWRSISERCPDVDTSAALGVLIGNILATSADPDMALNNLERLIAADSNPQALTAELAKRSVELHRLLLLLAGSQYFSDVIVAEPSLWVFLSEQGHKPISRTALRAELKAGVEQCNGDETVVLRFIRTIRKRELLRIGFRDVVHGHTLESITRSISDLADCLVDTALHAAMLVSVKRFGRPLHPDGTKALFAVIAMGKLGGRELNYSSDIDLIAIYDGEGETSGRRTIDNSEFFSEVTRRMIRLLSANTPDGVAYRVDFRLRPHGAQASLCLSLDSTVSYYDREGRTWERQAMVKARPIAGSKVLGQEFLRRIEDFVYRRQLTFVEINEIRSIKSDIEARTHAAGMLETDLKTGRGGIRDIEFVIQFLQLINGGKVPELRQQNTLLALEQLDQSGLINADEFEALDGGYRFLRKAEHRVQFLFDLQRHDIPTTQSELSKLAVRLGYPASDQPAERFLAELQRVTEQNRRILHRLMLDLFPNVDDERYVVGGDPTTDLVLDPNPDPERVKMVLSAYGFRNPTVAFDNLNLLARESVPFLSSARCRHFLASIAPRLLSEISAAPDPDMALTNLEKVSASLGAKGVLWESISQNQSLLRLFVHLCAWSQFLSEILINNPGMIDELLDTLTMNHYPTRVELETELDMLLKGATEIDPILHGFRNTKILAIGIRDMLGKISVREATRDLSDLAEIILRRVADIHFVTLISRYGVPTLSTPSEKNSSASLHQARYAIVAMGKFGGREIGYHSDLDLMLVYEGDGSAKREGFDAPEPIDNLQFFSELAQRIVRTLSWIGPLGRLYPVDLRLRPTGASGNVAAPLSRFVEYYRQDADPWEIQALTRSRVVHGEPTFAWRLTSTIRDLVMSFPFSGQFVDELYAMRRRLEESRAGYNIKRGVGGVMDVEFAVQLMQLKHGVRHPEILEANVWDCLDAIAKSGLWTTHRVALYLEGYTFIRRLESRIRIVQNLAHDNLPDNEADLRKLALRMGDYDPNSAAQDLKREVESWMHRIREEFLATLEDERQRP